LICACESLFRAHAFRTIRQLPRSGLACHDHPLGSQGRPGRDGRRRPGVDGPDHRQGHARKVRRIGNGQIIAGFAGATADAFTLFERLEAKLERHPGQLLRAAIELAKDWRTDRYLRKLEALMAVADKDVSLLLSGTGDVLEPEGGIIAIGSGGNYALSAARALIDVEGLDAEAIARKSMKIAADICVYTNHNIVIEKL